MVLIWPNFRVGSESESTKSDPDRHQNIADSQHRIPDMHLSCENSEPALGKNSDPTWSGFACRSVTKLDLKKKLPTTYGPVQ
jgi:hypothetical protein